MKFLSIKPILFGLIATSLALTHTWAMDEIISPFETKELKLMIVSGAAVEQVLISKPLADLALANKEWLEIVKTAASQVNGPLWKALQGVRDENDGATYQAFLNGKLVYRPAPGRDVVELKISDFLSPFKGTFDLSKCGEAAQHLTITTDPSVFFQVNKERPTCHILIAPYFLIKKHLPSSAKSFEIIMGTWDKDKAPVGMFWRWSAHDNLSWYDYLSTAELSNMGSKNLSASWCRSTEAAVSWRQHRRKWAAFFMLFFDQK